MRTGTNNQNLAAQTSAASAPAEKPRRINLSDAAMRVRKLVVAEHDLRIVCNFVTLDVAPKTAAKLRSALKSIAGAIRHAERMAAKDRR